MALAKRDMCILRMEEELNRRQNYMNSRGDEIVGNTEVNPLLKKVLKEYIDYYDEETSIMRHKQDGLSKILHYSDKIIDEGNLSKEDLEKTQNHYNSILDKFEEINNNLQSLNNN